MAGDQSHGLAEAPAAGALADLVGGALHQVRIPQISAQSGAVGSLGVDRITTGQATIDRVEINGINASLSTGQAVLRNVRAVLRLRVGVAIRVRIAWVRFSASPSVTFRFRFDIGDTQVPSLDDIELSIPQATVRDAEAIVQPINNLDLGGGTFSDIEVNDTRLPQSGFGLSGLGFEGFRLSDVTVPAATSGSVFVGELRPNEPFVLPDTEIRAVELPVIRVPFVSSQAPIEIRGATPLPARLEEVIFNRFGVRIAPFAEPVLDIHISSLTLSDIDASSSIDRVRLADVRSPVTLQGLRMGDLQLNQVTVNQVVA